MSAVTVYGPGDEIKVIIVTMDSFYSKIPFHLHHDKL